MKKFLLVAVPTILVASFFLYRFMGGGKDLSFTIVESPGGRTLYGNWFRGQPDDRRLDSLFFVMREKADFDSQRFLAVITVPSINTDSIEQFIGVLGAKDDELDSYRLPETRYIETTLDMHPAMMPSPDNVREQAEIFATSIGLILGPEDVQVFESESSVLVWFRVAD